MFFSHIFCRKTRFFHKHPEQLDLKITFFWRFFRNRSVSLLINTTGHVKKRHKMEGFSRNLSKTQNIHRKRLENTLTLARIVVQFWQNNDFIRKYSQAFYGWKNFLFSRFWTILTTAIIGEWQKVNIFCFRFVASRNSICYFFVISKKCKKWFAPYFEQKCVLFYENPQNSDFLRKIKIHVSSPKDRFCARKKQPVFKKIFF